MKKPLKVLTVEDSEDDALLLARQLRNAGLEAELTRVDTPEALRAALGERPWDLVLCDYSMPHFSGMAALQTIRERSPDVPVIFVSGMMGEDLAVEAMRAGANDYLMKGHLKRLGPAVERELRDATVRAERRRAEAEVRRVNRALRMLSDSNQTLIRSTEEASLLDALCHIMVEQGGYRMAWVGFAEHDPAQTIRPAAHAGFEAGYLASVHLTWAENERGRSPGGLAIRTGQACVVRDIPGDPAFAPWREEALRRGYRSIIALPLTSEGQTFGALGVYAAEVGAFDAEEIEILKELAGDVAFGLTALRTRAERNRAEKTLALFRALIDRTNDVIEVVDPATGRFLDVNDKACQTHGFTRQEYLSLSVFDLETTLPPAQREFWPQWMAEVRAAGFKPFEGRHRRKDGSSFPVEVLVNYVQLDRDYVVSVVRDITDRKRAEEALRQSERRNAILNRILNIFLTVPDDEMYGKVLAVAMEVMRSKFGLFGFIAENGDLVIPSLTRGVWNQCQVPEKSCVFPPPSWGTSLWGRAMRERKSFASDGPFHVPEGHLHIDHFLVVPIVFGAETIGLLAVANAEHSYSGEEQELLESISSNISPILNARLQRDRQEKKRKRAEETLRKLSRAVEQSSASIVITNTAGDIEYVNPKFSRLTGYLPAEVIGQNPRVLKSGQTPPEEYGRLWRTITAGQEWRGEFRNRKKNGEFYWELASISPILDAAGVITHFVAVKEDITEHKRLEAAFRQAQKMEAVGQLAGGVAHDFNNILAAIMINVGILQEGPELSPEMITGLKELEREANLAASLTRQLLLFSRRQVLMAEPLDLNEVVQNMTRMLRRLIGEDVRFLFQGQATRLWVMADAGMMDQVLMNLCVNARDAMPDGGLLTIGTRQVEIDAEAALKNPEAQAGVFICLSVTDTGCGMGEETLKHIFEPFFTTKEAGKGTGLGLATVYGIVRQHHGWIEVKSALGQGTTFHVYLPALAAVAGNQTAADQGEVRGGTETLLVVEDDHDLRRLVAAGLRKLGYAVLEAENGKDALQVWRQPHPPIALLFTDMVMPEGLTGIELAERLRKEKKALQVIVSSGYNPDKAKPDVLKGQGITFLAKPFEMLLLAKTVRSCLDQAADRTG